MHLAEIAAWKLAGSPLEAKVCQKLNTAGGNPLLESPVVGIFSIAYSVCWGFGF